MPGCDCENSNFQIAYDEQTSVVKQFHPDWSDREVRIDVAQFLRPKFRQDLDSRNAERQGIEKSEPIEFELTKDGTDILFTKYGRTLSELNERTRTLTPEQYNPVDAITNAAIISAIKQGAGHIVTSYWRPNGDNRDLLEITFNSKTGVGTSCTINTESRTGKTHQYDEMSDHAKLLYNDLQVQKPDQKVFIATDISLDITQIRQEILENDVQKFDEISDIAQSGIASAERIVEDVKESISGSEVTISVQDYFINATNEILLARPEYIQSEVIHSFETVFDLLDGSLTSNALVELSTYPDIEDVTVDLQDLWIQKATESLSISESDASLLLITTSKLNDIFLGQRDSLQLVESLGVGQGAIFFALETFTMTELPIPQQEKLSIAIDEYSDVSNLEDDFSNKQTAEIYSVLFATNVLDSIQEKPIEQQLKILQELNLPEYTSDVDFVHFINVIEFIQIVDSSPSEQKIELIKTEQQKAMEKIHILHQTIVEMITRYSANLEQTTRYSEFVQINQDQSNESVSNKQDIHTENFSLALSFWMMIKMIQYVSTLHKMETYVKKQLLSPDNIETQLPASFAHEHAADVIQKESAPWLLLAIIWHLAMIREQGFAQSNVQTTTQQTKKHNKKNVRSLPISNFWIDQSRVIYAYGS